MESKMRKDERREVRGAIARFCAFVSLFIFFASSLSAAVPVKFNYQGNLRQGGFLVNGTRNMIFRIYDSSATSANLLWTSGVYSVAVSTGVFRVTLEPALADWESKPLWIELEVNGTTLSPREELTSSPFSINTLLISGKRYTTSDSVPAVSGVGDLWMDTSAGTLKYHNGADWVLSSVGGSPAAHAMTHGFGGGDAITSLGSYTLTGSITMSAGSDIKAAAGTPYVSVSTNLYVSGTINPSANTSIGGAGYSVSLASSVTGGWFYGNGSGLSELNASKITSGQMSGDRISASVLVSSHIADKSLNRLDLGASGCADGEILKWNNATLEWICSNDNAVAGGEVDPVSIHIQDTLQTGTTFYVSSGTLNYLTVNNRMDVFGLAKMHGAPGKEGLSVNSSGNVAIGLPSASARLEVKAEEAQPYSVAVGTGTAYQMVVSTAGSMGIGTQSPSARLEVTGQENHGSYIMILNSGSKIAAWLRNK